MESNSTVENFNGTDIDFVIYFNELDGKSENLLHPETRNVRLDLQIPCLRPRVGLAQA